MESMILELQEKLQSIINEPSQLSGLAKKGNQALVERFLTEAVHIGDTKASKLQTQLYMACFWGIDDIVQQLIQLEEVDINAQNVDTLWTPLHAATFQEQGKVVMLLLQKGADPNLEDFEGRTPKDFASASSIIWPHFAHLDCLRTPYETLVEQGILREGEMGESATSSEPDWKVNYGLQMGDYTISDRQNEKTEYEQNTE